MKMSQKILAHRKQRGMSQEELAERLNVSRQAVSRWELGTAQPEAHNVWQLSRLFGVTADYLLDEEDESDGLSPPPSPAAAAPDGAAAAPAHRDRGTTAAWVTAAVGAAGNLVIYLLSRFIPVMVPIVTHSEDGRTWYTYSSTHTDYSWRYFVDEHNLELLTAALWLLTLAGLVVVLLRQERVRARIAAWREARQEARQEARLRRREEGAGRAAAPQDGVSADSVAEDGLGEGS